MNVTNYVSDPTTPIKLEVSSQATSNIELEVSLSSGKYSYIAIYPEIRIYIDDYVQMDVRDSISIVVTANARNEYIRKASVYSSLTLQQNRAYFYSFPNSEKTLQSAMSKTVSFDPEILALQELYMNETIRARTDMTLESVLYESNTAAEKITISIQVPKTMAVLTKPGIWHNIKTRFVKFVYYFIPLYFVIHWLMRKAFEWKLCHVSSITDFPKQFISRQEYF